jgi:hypothetical protein
VARENQVGPDSARHFQKEHITALPGGLFYSAASPRSLGLDVDRTHANAETMAFRQGHYKAGVFHRPIASKHMIKMSYMKHECR